MTVENRDASYLTEKYSGQERELWTPCLHTYFKQHKPTLPVRECVPGESSKFRDRRSAPKIAMTGEILLDPGYSFLEKIDKAFNVSLVNDPKRYVWRSRNGKRKKCDIAGFQPDIFLIDAKTKRVVIFENKPYEYSTLTGPQEQDYVDFVLWLQRKKIECEYLFVSPHEWTRRKFPALVKMQKTIPGSLGFIWYEDIFSKMAADGFDYAELGKPWSDYTLLNPKIL